MKTKDFVKQKYPQARSERHRARDGQTYWVIRDDATSNRISVFKSTENEAWNSAKSEIEKEITYKQSILKSE